MSQVKEWWFYESGRLAQTKFDDVLSQTKLDSKTENRTHRMVTWNLASGKSTTAEQAFLRSMRVVDREKKAFWITNWFWNLQQWTWKHLLFEGHSTTHTKQRARLQIHTFPYQLVYEDLECVKVSLGVTSKFDLTPPDCRQPGNKNRIQNMSGDCSHSNISAQIILPLKLWQIKCPHEKKRVSPPMQN